MQHVNLIAGWFSALNVDKVTNEQERLKELFVSLADF